MVLFLKMRGQLVRLVVLWVTSALEQKFVLSIWRAFFIPLNVNYLRKFQYAVGEAKSRISCRKKKPKNTLGSELLNYSFLPDRGSPFTIRNHPVKTQTFDFPHVFACNTSQMQFPCNIRLSLAYHHDN